MEPEKMTKNPKKQHKTPPESMGVGAVDGRKGTAKRFKQIVSALNRESRHEHIGHAEAAMIDVAAIALLRLEQIKARVLNGDDVNDEDLVRLTNAAVRAVAALGATKRKGKPPSDTLADHIARIKSKAKP
jgi:MoxR-like ATPase